METESRGAASDPRLDDVRREAGLGGDRARYSALLAFVRRYVRDE